MVESGPVSSPAEFAATVAAHPFDGVALNEDELEVAAGSVASAGVLVVGELHGVRETPTVLYAIATAAEVRAIAFEWSHEEMDDILQTFMSTGAFDFERLWALPASAELFCGDGRIAAGHFALLARLRDEGLLEQVIAYDRLDPVPGPKDWQVRERDLAGRLLARWDRRLPLLVLTGAFHARIDAEEGPTMTDLIRRELPGVQSAMLDYARGNGWSRGTLHDLSVPMPDAPIRLAVPHGTPAIVPASAS